MDINFHYYAVKTLAYAAGFPEAEAQVIAEFSQFVDDFDERYYKGKLTPFNTAIREVDSMTDYHQKYTISPFHFIPKQKMEDKPEKYKNLGTTPANIGDESIISTLLDSARQTLRQSNARALVLMQIGVYLHIFADTYAHQSFSGYRSDINKAEIVKVNHADESQAEIDPKGLIYTSLIGGRDLTAQLNTIAGIPFDVLPPIGHARAGHLPDLTYVYFTLNKGGHIYGRDNCEEFLIAAREIYNYLCTCIEQPADAWTGLVGRMRKVFLKDYVETDEPAMTQHWDAEFHQDGYIYNYSKDAIIERLQSSDYFLWFNNATKNVLIELYSTNGSDPRRA